jgi:hypothetical protein
MGGACSMYDGNEKSIQDFSREEAKRIKHLRDLDIDGKIILNLILQK